MDLNNPLVKQLQYVADQLGLEILDPERVVHIIESCDSLSAGEAAVLGTYLIAAAHEAVKEQASA